MNTSSNPVKTGDPAATSASGKPVNTVNERTYQEVEYLKKNLGPILVAALAEICIRRPADPIEYLGHWLLRWRYNEELKRRDVQNALDVVRQRQWAQVQEETAATKVEKYASGFIPGQAHGPPGYGGPLSGEELGETHKEVEEAEFHPTEEVTGEGGESTPHHVHPHSSGHGHHADHADHHADHADHHADHADHHADHLGTDSGHVGDERKTSLGKSVDGSLPGHGSSHKNHPEERKTSVGKEHAHVDPGAVAEHPHEAIAAEHGQQDHGHHVEGGERKVSVPQGEHKKVSVDHGGAAVPPESDHNHSDEPATSPTDAQKHRKHTKGPETHEPIPASMIEQHKNSIGSAPTEGEHPGEQRKISDASHNPQGEQPRKHSNPPQ